MKTEKIKKLKHLKILHDNLAIYLPSVKNEKPMSQQWKTGVWGVNYYMKRIEELLMEIINEQ